MLDRNLKLDILHYLKHFPAIFITGARQVGKSTLAMNLGINNYVTLDDISIYQSAQKDPKGFMEYVKTPVVIDEIQRSPKLMLSIKAIIDRNRVPGQFVLTGSSSLQGFKNLSDSLAGRIGIVELFPLSLSEIYADKTNLIDFLFSDSLSKIKSKSNVLWDRVLLGGFPEVQKIKDIKTKYLWSSSYISTYIERDARDLGEIRNLDGFMRLYLSLAFRSANVAVRSEIGKECRLDNKTLDHYLSILKNTYQIVWLKPFFRNHLKRIIKSPKIYMLDSGILSHLLKIDTKEKLLQSEYKGVIFETFLFSEILKSLGTANHRVELSYYRTNDGKEIDFILDDGKSIIAVEAKSSKTVGEADFKHIRSFSIEMKNKVSKGIVFYDGDRVLSFGEFNKTKLLALPIH